MRVDLSVAAAISAAPLPHPISFLPLPPLSPRFRRSAPLVVRPSRRSEDPDVLQEWPRGDFDGPREGRSADAARDWPRSSSTGRQRRRSDDTTIATGRGEQERLKRYTARRKQRGKKAYASEGERLKSLFFSNLKTVGSTAQPIEAMARKSLGPRIILKHVDDILKLSDASLSAKDFTVLMKACEAAGRGDRVVSLLDEMDARGVQRDAIVSNAAARILSTANCAKEAGRVMDRMREDSVAKLPSAYSHLFKAAQTGRQARQVLDLMASEGVHLDVFSYTAAISACAHTKDVSTALDLLGEMESKGMPPSAATCTAALSVCARAGQWQEAIHLLHRFQDTADVRTYTAAISACGIAGQWEEALNLMDDMRDEGVAPNVWTYTEAMRACIKGGVAEEAIQLFDKMTNQKQNEPSTICYSVALRACEQAKATNKARDIFKRLSRSQVEELPPKVRSWLLALVEKDERRDMKVVYERGVEHV
ncbi:unnamed protein product [Vitrella brassicaformis CCMP3155]|uniref:PROP1-like PPR domain-containing protein n=2 Tax=Vitrella brassicaformis TaxID=1169539 RepID=A0A0G4EUW8_VITBC|nr:unnamed protein product [Vitrella brassicaformis CCMP3155]|eukprot:CEM02250.1 unnamed protein product [Vitrella brassicaformis CCMP3155]